MAKAKDFLQNLIREKDMSPKPALDIDMAEFRHMRSLMIKAQTTKAAVMVLPIAAAYIKAVSYSYTSRRTHDKELSAIFFLSAAVNCRADKSGTCRKQYRKPQRYVTVISGLRRFLIR